MLYRDGNKWSLSPYKVKYIQNGETLEKYTNNKQWWVDFAQQWEHTQIVEFTDVIYTNEQLNRLKEIEDIADGFGDICGNYVEFGVFPFSTTHKLRGLQLEKENADLWYEVMSISMGAM